MLNGGNIKGFGHFSILRSLCVGFLALLAASQGLAQSHDPADPAFPRWQELKRNIHALEGLSQHHALPIRLLTRLDVYKRLLDGRIEASDLRPGQSLELATSPNIILDESQEKAKEALLDDLLSRQTYNSRVDLERVVRALNVLQPYLEAIAEIRKEKPENEFSTYLVEEALIDAVMDYQKWNDYQPYSGGAGSEGLGRASRRSFSLSFQKTILSLEMTEELRVEARELAYKALAAYEGAKIYRRQFSSSESSKSWPRRALQSQRAALRRVLDKAQLLMTFGSIEPRRICERLLKVSGDEN